MTYYFAAVLFVGVFVKLFQLDSKLCLNALNSQLQVYRYDFQPFNLQISTW